ncbi:hypothetical protein [Nonomuraea sp. NPDC049141]|uniref:hypothetical protein n=1 Tax=Nonomuraea sp. NPDC049141 TaxID=3155500 RepID=UPI003400CC07
MRCRLALPDPKAGATSGVRQRLALYLAAQLVDAAQDLAHAPAGHLHHSPGVRDEEVCRRFECGHPDQR